MQPDSKLRVFYTSGDPLLNIIEDIYAKSLLVTKFIADFFIDLHTLRPRTWDNIAEEHNKLYRSLC
jgi:hypothetical protein